LQEGVTSFDGPLVGAIEAEFQVQGVAVKVQGNTLVIRGYVTSLENAYAWLTWMNALFPVLMSLKFSVFVWIKTFEARIGEGRYRLDSSTLRYTITTSTVEERIAEVKSSIEDWLGCRHERHHRMYSAFYYLRHAQRLAVLQPCSESMVGEVILNLAKSLEVVFGSAQRDVIRDKARQWGIHASEVETFIVPLVLLRNEMDVAHVGIEPLTPAQRQILLDFMGAAMIYIRGLLQRIFQGASAGSVQLDPVPSSNHDRSRLLQRIATQLTVYRADREAASS
jgi:hypothetical protein